MWCCELYKWKSNETWKCYLVLMDKWHTATITFVCCWDSLILCWVVHFSIQGWLALICIGETKCILDCGLSQSWQRHWQSVIGLLMRAVISLVSVYSVINYWIIIGDLSWSLGRMTCLLNGYCMASLKGFFYDPSTEELIGNKLYFTYSSVLYSEWL